jgi:gas vesicle protein
MAENERTEMITAFAIGAVIGVGATLLFRPEPPTRRERLAREIRPLVKKARRAGSRSRKSLERGFRASRETGAELADASREILEDFRDRLDRIVESAARDARRAVNRRTKGARKALSRHNRWFR